MFWLSKQYLAVERVCFISRWPKCSLWVCVKFYCCVLFLSLCRLTNRCLILRFRNISYVHTITSIFTPLTWFRGDAWATSKKINHSLIYDHRTLSPMSLVRSNSPSPQIKIPRYQWLTTRDVTQNVVISSRSLNIRRDSAKMKQQ